jgi:hypothetical protein
MKKLISGFSLLFVGLLVASCVDKHEEVDEESRPDWLGGSIYEELSTRQSGQLEGTFTTYLRLVDDLGYGETLSRTGSKTVFLLCATPPKEVLTNSRTESRIRFLMALISSQRYEKTRLLCFRGGMRIFVCYVIGILV